MTETVFAYVLLRFPFRLKNPNMYSPIVAFEFSDVRTKWFCNLRIKNERS